jgi:hypothetical protein
MAIQHTATTPRAHLVEARTIRGIAAVAAALAIEAVLIASVVLSSIGISPAWHPTPGGPSPERIPAAVASGQSR